MPEGRCNGWTSGKHTRAWALVWAVLACCSAFGRAAGLPEPGLVLYGVVRSSDGSNLVRLTTGSVRGEITPPSGPAVVIRTNLQNLNDQFSYVFDVPFETSLGGGVTSNTLALLPGGGTYTLRLFVGTNATTAAVTNTFTFGPADRGRQQRLDFQISSNSGDANQNGLPDWWEQLYFGGAVSASADPDQDGLNNLGEYRAGTNPTNAASAFAFINVLRDAQPGPVVRWASVSNRSYQVLRAVDLLGVYGLVASNLAATPPVNVYRDTNAPSSAAFYKLVVE